MNGSELTKGCPKCGRVIGDEVEICPYCGYKFAEINAYFSKVADEKFNVTGKYAGLLKRIIAFLTDVVFIGGVSLIVLAITLCLMDFVIPPYLYLITFLLVLLIYKILMEGFFSATIGKKLVGIEVVTRLENKISIKESIVRNLSLLLDVITLGIGFIMIAFTKDKVALHDVVAKTLVVNSNEETVNDSYAPGAIRLVAFAIDIAIVYGLIYLIGMGFDYIESNYILSDRVSSNIPVIEFTISLVIAILYFVMLETGSRGASIGKRLTGIKIETLDGDRMGFFRALIRTLCLSIEILTFGYMLCAFTNKKQTLKDKIVGTKVNRI